MAATVEGMFKIIDGASGPMRKMELQAKKTDDSIDKLGKRLDTVGSDDQLRRMDSVDRQIKTIDRDATSFSSSSGGGGKLSRSLRDSSNESDRLSTKLGRVGISLASIGKIFQAMKLPIIASGIGALVQGVDALAGGAVALIPKLTDLAGVAGVLPATFTGIGLAVAATKLSFTGMSKALSGTKGAMKELTPQAREFVRVLKEMKPIGKQLQSSAQKGLFPGLTGALGKLKKGVPTAEGLLEKGGSTVGGIAERAASAFTAPGFLKDLKSVGGQGLEIVNRMGSGLINLVEALRNVAVAAEPFTTWLSKTVLGWTHWIAGAAEAGRETGRLQGYFERTKSALETFGNILKNLWETFKGIGHAARPLGEGLWESAEKATAKWAEFANSLKGQSDLKSWFESLKESIYVIFNFVGKLGDALAKLGGGSGFTKVAESLTGALEPLEEIFEMFANEYGPAFAKTIEQLVDLFNNLGGGSSVLIKTIEVFNMFLEAINKLLEAVPGLSNLITVVLGAFALDKLGVRLSAIATKWTQIATAAADASVAQRNAVVAADGSAIAGAGPTFIGGAGRRSPLIGKGGRIYNSSVPAEGTFIAGAAGSGVETSIAGKATMGSRLFGGAGMAGLGSMAGDGLLAAGKFLWPIAAFMGATSALTTPGNVGEKIQGGLSGLTGGILPAPVSPGQQRVEANEDEQRKIQELLGETPRSKRGIQRSVRGLVTRAHNLAGDQLGLGSSEAEAFRKADHMTVAQQRQAGMDFHNDNGDSKRLEDIHEAIAGLRTEYSGVVKEERAEKRAHQAAERQRKIVRGGTLAAGFVKGQETNIKEGMSPAEAFSHATPRVLGDIEHLGAAGGSALARNYVKWAAVAEKENSKLEKPFEDLVEGLEGSFGTLGRKVEVVNGHIVEGTKNELTHWGNIINEKFSEGVSTSSKLMEELRAEALRALKLMGYSPGESQSILHEAEKGTPTKTGGQLQKSAHNFGTGATGTQNNMPTSGSGKKARGGRIPGFGNQDKYDLGSGNVGAAGELIVNKHTESKANAMLGMFGTNLGELVGKEGTPHSELVMHSRGGRFARGGRARGGGGSVVIDPGVNMSVGEEPSILKDLYALSGELGETVYVISGYRSPAHSVAVGGFADDPHTQGAAADIGVGSPSLESMASVTAAQLAAAGLYRQFYPASAHEVNHVELIPGGPKGKLGVGAAGVTGLGGLGGAGATGAAQSVNLKRHKSGLGGVPGAIATRGNAMMAAGLEQKLNGILGAKAAAAGGAGGVGGFVKSGAGVIPTIGRGLMSHGLNKIGAAGIIGNALQESAWNPGSIGSGGGGLWGFTASPYSLGDLQAYASGQGRPWDDAGLQTQFLLKFLSPSLISGLNSSATPGAAAAYFMNEWERPAVATENQARREQGAAQAFSMGYSKGGRMPNFAGWFGTGGSVTATGPTLMGIGESGTEVATVRHKSKGTAGGGGGGISVGSITVHNHRSGDVRKQVEREVHDALKQVARDLDYEPDTADDEVLT